MVNALLSSAIIDLVRRTEKLIDLGIKVLENKVADIERQKAYDDMSKVPSRDSESD